MNQPVYRHEWTRVESSEELSRLKCTRCGIIVDEVLPWVPNLYGATEVEIDCNDSVIQQVHEETMQI